MGPKTQRRLQIHRLLLPVEEAANGVWIRSSHLKSLMPLAVYIIGRRCQDARTSIGRNRWSTESEYSLGE